MHMQHVLFLLTFIIVGGVVYFIAILAAHAESDKALIAGVVCGLVFACLLLKLWRASLFACGACVGFVLWVGFKSL